MYNIRMTSAPRKSTETLLRNLQAELLQEKTQVADDADPVELDQARVGRLSRMDDMQRQAMAQEQARRRELQLQRIEGALQRLEQGTYGLCARCRKPIDEKRLDFDPTTFFCITCAEAAEKQ
jgi:DnaK suppressor protein